VLQRKTEIISIALVLGVASIIALQTYLQFSRPPQFEGCYRYQGRTLILTGGKLLVDGVANGSFQLHKGDATKGPDSLVTNLPLQDAFTRSLDHNRVWFVVPEGVMLPTSSGDYTMAAPC
jgi:hypothetical protein